MEILKIINRYLTFPFVGLVVVYQKTLSPDHGLFKAKYPYGFCKFHPSCSEYARLTLLKDGLVGVPKIINRVIKCNPFSKPAIDRP
jgi:putative component of membrane protein insertase Oxa1/YidC/SpoIIIJ protein YidD